VVNWSLVTTHKLQEKSAFQSYGKGTKKRSTLGLSTPLHFPYNLGHPRHYLVEMRN